MFKLIAGPCVIESRDILFQIAERMKDITSNLGIDYYFKASFDKANRTSINSFRGQGLERGLEMLSEVKERFGLRIATDIHEPSQAEVVAKVVDIIQIPAFLCRQTDLLLAAGKTGRLVNIKKAQFLSAKEMSNVAKKLESIGCKNLWLCERGTFFGYNSLVVDMTNIIEMKKFGYPVIFDATHSVQKPGGDGETTGGNREYVWPLAKAAIAVGADGLFMEVHPHPEQALSDGPNMVRLNDMPQILENLVSIYTNR